MRRQVALEAIAHRKHLILMNAELDGTIGPILKVHADRAGVVITNVDGDQPGVTHEPLPLRPRHRAQARVAGNIKGLHDPYRNPTTQEGFSPAMNQTGAYGDQLCRWHQDFL